MNPLVFAHFALPACIRPKFREDPHLSTPLGSRRLVAFFEELCDVFKLTWLIRNGCMVAGGFVDELYRAMYPVWDGERNSSAFDTETGQMRIILKMMSTFFDTGRDIDVFFVDRRVVETYLWFAVHFAEYHVSLMDNGVVRIRIPDATDALREMTLNFIDVSFFMKWENCRMLSGAALLEATLHAFHLPCCQAGLMQLGDGITLVRTTAYFYSQRSRYGNEECIAIGRMADIVPEDKLSFRRAVRKYESRGYNFIERDGLQLYAEGNGPTYPHALDVFFALPRTQDSLIQLFSTQMDDNGYISTDMNIERKRQADKREHIDVAHLRKLKRQRTEESEVAEPNSRTLVHEEEASPDEFPSHVAVNVP